MGNDRQSVDKRTIIENYDLVSLAIDEIIDDGIILETDPTIIVQRVSKAPTQDVTQLKGIDLSEQGMNNLAQFDARKAQVVEMRFFGGLSVDETAEVLKVSPVTVMRDWSTAKAWLYRELAGGTNDGLGSLETSR